jgi:hypothetical protein
MYFYSSCLYVDCYSDLGRSGEFKLQALLQHGLLMLKTEWMDAFAYACVKVNKPLVDINDQWKPYIPAWYLNRPLNPSPSSTIPSPTAVVASSTATVIANGITSNLSNGAVVGVVISSIVAFGAMSLCGIFYWRSRKKLKRKSREVAQMADALRQDGFTRRIDQLRYGQSDANLGLMPALHDQCGYDKSLSINGQYVPARAARESHSQEDLGTITVTENPDLYHAHMRSVECESEGSGQLSRKFVISESQAGLDTTAVTTTPDPRHLQDPDGCDPHGIEVASSAASVYDEDSQKYTC